MPFHSLANGALQSYDAVAPHRLRDTQCCTAFIFALILSLFLGLNRLFLNKGPRKAAINKA